MRIKNLKIIGGINMFIPTIEQVSDLIKVREILTQFDSEFKTNLDEEDEIDSSLNNMIDLIKEGFDSVLMVMKARL